MATAIGVILEYATETSPTWLSVDPWRPWLLLGVLVLLALVLAMVTAREPAVAQPGSSASTSPRFLVAPASLRAPRADFVLGRTDELAELAHAIRQKSKKRPEQFVVVTGPGGIG